MFYLFYVISEVALSFPLDDQLLNNHYMYIMWVNHTFLSKVQMVNKNALLYFGGGLGGKGVLVQFFLRFFLIDCCGHCRSDRGQWGRGSGGAAVPRFWSRFHRLLCVAFSFHQDDVALGQKDADQHAQAGGQDGEYLNGHHELPDRAEVGRDEGYPHDEEDEEAEGQRLPFSETHTHRTNMNYVHRKFSDEHHKLRPLCVPPGLPYTAKNQSTVSTVTRQQYMLFK